MSIIKKFKAPPVNYGFSQNSVKEIEKAKKRSRLVKAGMSLEIARMVVSGDFSEKEGWELNN